MRRVIVTGGAGFIGFNYVRELLAAEPRDRGHRPRQADLRRQPALARRARRRAAPQVRPAATSATARLSASCSRRAKPAADRPLRGREPRRSLDRRPRGLHPDQRRRHVPPARGVPPLPRAAPEPGVPVPPRLDRRGVRRARPDRRVHRDHAVRSALAVLGVEGGERSPRQRVRPHLQVPGGHDELLEQLRAVSVPREADPADDPERARRQAAAGLRQGRERPRLDLRHRSLQRDPRGAREAAGSASAT